MQLKTAVSFATLANVWECILVFYRSKSRSQHSATCRLVEVRVFWVRCVLGALFYTNAPSGLEWLSHRTAPKENEWVYVVEKTVPVASFRWVCLCTRTQCGDLWANWIWSERPCTGIMPSGAARSSCCRSRESSHVKFVEALVAVQKTVIYLMTVWLFVRTFLIESCSENRYIHIEAVNLVRTAYWVKSPVWLSRSSFLLVLDNAVLWDIIAWLVNFFSFLVTGDRLF